MTRPWAVSQCLAAVAVVAASAGLWSEAPHAQSYDRGAMAIVSGTMGVNANRLCVGKSTRGDIGCPDYAPSALGGNIFGPGSLAGAVAGATNNTPLG